MIETTSAAPWLDRPTGSLRREGKRGESRCDLEKKTLRSATRRRVFGRAVTNYNNYNMSRLHLMMPHQHLMGGGQRGP